MEYPALIPGMNAIAFTRGSGAGVYHRAALRADPLAASRRIRLFISSWFETAHRTAQVLPGERLLTMRNESHQTGIAFSAVAAEA
jgi:hypothetical protein